MTQRRTPLLEDQRLRKNRGKSEHGGLSSTFIVVFYTREAYMSSSGRQPAELMIIMMLMNLLLHRHGTEQN